MRSRNCGNLGQGCSITTRWSVVGISGCAQKFVHVSARGLFTGRVSLFVAVREGLTAHKLSHTCFSASSIPTLGRKMTRVRIVWVARGGGAANFWAVNFSLVAKLRCDEAFSSGSSTCETAAIGELLRCTDILFRSFQSSLGIDCRVKNLPPCSAGQAVLSPNHR